jgi:hypothetical protein
MSDQLSFLDSFLARQKELAARRQQLERYELIVGVADWLRLGGGGKGWIYTDGRPEMAADLAEWFERSVAMARDFGVGGEWAAALSADRDTSENDRARQAARELVAAAADRDAETMGRLAGAVVALGLTWAVSEAFSDACGRVAVAFRDLWLEPQEEHWIKPKGREAGRRVKIFRKPWRAGLGKAFKEWEGRLEKRFQPRAPVTVATADSGTRKPSAPRLTFDDATHTACFDGEQFAGIDAEAYTAFKIVAELRGEIISSDKITKEPALFGRRLDKIWKRLPDALRKLVKTKRGSKNCCLELPNG